MLKVPKKSKSYEQEMVRTMFFRKCEKIQIDYKTYDISNPTQVELWNCKSAMCDVFAEIDMDKIEMIEPTNYLGWRKELISKLKEFDKIYVKHMKKNGGHDE